MAEKPNVDWERIEAEYRAGQISVREIARIHGLAENSIRKRATRDGWTRALADKVREAVAEKLVRSDGAQIGAQEKRAQTDRETIEAAATRGLIVIKTHRRDLERLHNIRRLLAERLEAHLRGDADVGLCVGDKESPSDVLDKLARVTAKLIPLERQAYNLNSEPVSDTSGTAVQIYLPSNGRD